MSSLTAGTRGGLSESEVAERLLAYLRVALNRPELSYAEQPVRLAGGNETLIYAFRLERAPVELAKPLILRAYREGNAQPDQARFEAAVQNALAGLGYPAARVPLVCLDASSLGTQFVVMERLPGTMVLEGVGELDAAGQVRFARYQAVLQGLRLLQEIPRMCAEAQIRLHGLDPKPLLQAIEREGLSPSWVTIDGRLEALRRRIAAAKLDELREALFWLVEHVPRTERLAICHGDTQPNNILMSGKTITGVVDWSQAIVADQAFDVGYTKVALETVPLHLPRLLQWTARPIAALVSRRYRKLYTKRFYVDPEAVEYYGVLRATFALALIGGRRRDGLSEPDVWDSPDGVRNLVARVRSATGIEVALPAETRTAAGQEVGN